MRLIGSRYALYDELAAGGMATVHYGRLAGGDGFTKRVAIKCLHPQFGKDPDFVDMFLDEARLSARIQHPNVVQTLDVVRDGSELFLVMEYVHGESLSRLARSERLANGPVPLGIALRIVLDVLAGLEAAHDAKGPTGEPLAIVHRDISPQNVLVGADGVARLIDFGVAKARGRMRTTPSGQVKGKLAYMAPEQLKGTAVTPQSDLYAVTILLWEIVTGRRLFSGETEAQTMALTFAGKVPRPSEIVSTLPREIDEIIARGVMRDPRRRFTLAQEMSARIEVLPNVATRSEVKRWIASLASEELARRERKFVSIESEPLDLGSLRPPALDLGTSPTQTNVGVTSTREEPTRTTSVSTVEPRKRTRLGVWIGAGLLLVGATASAMLFARRNEPQSPVVGSPTPSAAPTGTPEPTAEVTAPSASAIESASPPVTNEPPGGARAAPVTRQPRNAPRDTRRGKNCNPPYTVDADGIQHFKRECL